MTIRLTTLPSGVKIMLVSYGTNDHKMLLGKSYKELLAQI